MKPSSHQTERPKKDKRAPQPLDVAAIPDALLKIPTVSTLAGMSPATVYRKAASDPDFPKLIKIGTRCTRIRAGDLMAWMAAQAAKAGA